MDLSRSVRSSDDIVKTNFIGFHFTLWTLSRTRHGHFFFGKISGEIFFVFEPKYNIYWILSRHHCAFVSANFFTFHWIRAKKSTNSIASNFVLALFFPPTVVDRLIKSHLTYCTFRMSTSWIDFFFCAKNKSENYARLCNRENESRETFAERRIKKKPDFKLCFLWALNGKIGSMKSINQLNRSKTSATASFVFTIKQFTCGISSFFFFVNTFSVIGIY